MEASCLVSRPCADSKARCRCAPVCCSRVEHWWRGWGKLGARAPGSRALSEQPSQGGIPGCPWDQGNHPLRLKRPQRLMRRLGRARRARRSRQPVWVRPILDARERNQTWTSIFISVVFGILLMVHPSIPWAWFGSAEPHKILGI